MLLLKEFINLPLDNVNYNSNQFKNLTLIFYKNNIFMIIYLFNIIYINYIKKII